MKLATSTYVKIALIVVLCLGVCGFFGGCGRGLWWPGLVAPGGLLGCGAWLVPAVSEIDGVVQSDTPETTTEGSHFEIDAADIDAIELNWLAGEATVSVVPDGDTGGKILVDEVVDGGRAPVMVCANEGGTLSINYMEGRNGLSGCSGITQGAKNLTVAIPASLTERLQSFELEAASGRYTVEGLTCGALELGVASGEVQVAGLTADSLSLSLASGRVNAEGTVADNVDVDQASGDFTLRCADEAPASISGSLASGSITAELPASTAFNLAIDKTSGNFNNEFSEPAGADAPVCRVDFDILSGTFTLKPIG